MRDDTSKIIGLRILFWKTTLLICLVSPFEDRVLDGTPFSTKFRTSPDVYVLKNVSTSLLEPGDKRRQTQHLSHFSLMKVPEPVTEPLYYRFVHVMTIKSSQSKTTLRVLQFYPWDLTVQRFPEHQLFQEMSDTTNSYVIPVCYVVYTEKRHEVKKLQVTYLTSYLP